MEVTRVLELTQNETVNELSKVSNASVADKRLDARIAEGQVHLGVQERS